MTESKPEEFDYNLIKIMDAVIKSGNLTKAARILDLSVPSVSSSVNRLKKYFEETLFYRTSDGLKPTRAGLELHEAFSKAKQIIDEAINSVNKELKCGVLVRIICPDVIENYYFASLYSRMSEVRNNIEFSSQIFPEGEDETLQILQRKVDIVIGNTPLIHEHITTTKFFSFNDFVILCGEDNVLSSQKEFTLSHYYSLPHARYYDRYMGNPKQIFGGSININSPYQGLVKTLYMSSSIYGVINVIENTEMLAIFPRIIANFFIYQRRCNLVKFELPEEIKISESSLYIHYHSESIENKSIKEVISLLKTCDL